MTLLRLYAGLGRPQHGDWEYVLWTPYTGLLTGTIRNMSETRTPDPRTQPEQPETAQPEADPTAPEPDPSEPGEREQPDREREDPERER